MLRVDELEVAYGRITALRGVSIEVAQGEIVGIIGPNGAGKSTLTMTVAGSLKPVGGTVAFDGESIDGRPPEEIVGRGHALVPESRRIFGTLTVRENLDMGATSRRDADGVAADME